MTNANKPTISMTPSSNGTGGWTAFVTSPSAMPHTTPTSLAFGDSKDESPQTNITEAHAEAALEKRNPATDSGPFPAASANSSTNAAVSAQPSAAIVSSRRSSSAGRRVATRNTAKNKTPKESVESSRAMPKYSATRA